MKPNIDDLVLCAGTLQSSSIIDRIEPTAAAGFRGLSAFTTDFDPAEGGAANVPEVAKRIKDAGLFVAEIDLLANWFPSASGGPGLLGPASQDVFALAEALDARSVTAAVFPASVPSQDELIEAFALACDRAGESGLQLHLEFIPFTPVRTLAEAAAIVEGAGRDNGGIMLDVWHLTRSGGGPKDVEALAHLVRGVQLDDAPTKPGDNIVLETMRERLLPGEGDADVPGVIRALRAGGCTAPLGVEVFSDVLAALPPDETATRSYAAASRCVKMSLA